LAFDRVKFEMAIRSFKVEFYTLGLVAKGLRCDGFVPPDVDVDSRMDRPHGLKMIAEFIGVTA
jgi:hypothetical protein